MSRPLIAFVLLASTAIAAPGDKRTPAENLLAMAPEKAMVVVQVSGIETARERLNATIAKALPDLAPKAAKAIAEGLESLFDERDVKVLRGDAPVLFAISSFEGITDGGSLTLLLPTKNVDDFKKGFLHEKERTSLKKDGDLETLTFDDLEVPFFLVPIKGYVVLTAEKELAGRYAKGEVKGPTGISKETAQAFDSADLAAFVNVKEVNAKYGDQLQQFKGIAEALLKDGAQGINKSQMEQLKSVMDAAFQVLQDGSAGVLAVDFRPEGLRIKGLAQFAEKSATGEALAKHKPGPLTELGTLPVGQIAYSASILSLGSSQSAGMMAGAFSADDEEPAAKEAIAKLLGNLRGRDHGLVLNAGGMMSATGLELTRSKDATGIAADRLKVLQTITKTGTFMNVPLKEKPTIKEKAEKVGAFELHAVTVKFDLEKATADLPEEAKEVTRTSIKRTLGGEEIKFWFGTDGKTVLQVSGADWVAAKALAEAGLATGKSIGTDEAFQATRKQLPADASMLTILDTGRTAYAIFDLVKESVKGIPGFPLQLPDVKEPMGTAAYVGIAVVLKPGHGGFEFFVPTAAVAQIRKLLGPILDKDE